MHITGIYRCKQIRKKQLTEVIKKFISIIKNEKHIIAGDFNINIQNATIKNKEFLPIMLDDGYYPAFKG